MSGQLLGVLLPPAPTSMAQHFRTSSGLGLLFGVCLSLAPTSMAQVGWTAHQAEAEARPLAIAAAGDPTIASPTTMVAGLPWSELGEPVDPESGTSRAWKFNYVYGPLGPSRDQACVDVVMRSGVPPSVRAYRCYPSGVPPVPIPPGLIGSDGILAEALSRVIVNGWSGRAFIQTYTDATVYMKASATPGSTHGGWEVVFNSARCNVQLASRFGYDAEGNLVRSGGNYPSMLLGSCPATAEEGGAPHSVAIGGARPNPTAGGVDVPFHLSFPAHVRVEVYDVIGRRVALLLDELTPAGHHVVRWNGANVPAGQYFCRVTTGGERATTPITVAR